ncbi:MAG: hypothetical protein PSV22_23670 [Pseudolabrys sp.]|nr:hypothetical protein [Pseudolabrys sp.]
MRAETAIRLRISGPLKAEWQARARADGISLSHALRTAGRLGMLLGPARLQEAVSAISALRRDLHVAVSELRDVATSGPGIEPDRRRAAIASVHEAAEATTTFLRNR